MKSSQAALDLITSEETGGAAYYRAKYRHFDWPEGVSGPTIGDGYDCGYATPAEAVADWTGIVSDDTVAHIVAACGLRGEAAHRFVRERGTSVTVEWEQATRQFAEREMPKQEAELDAALPNTALLSGDSYGALASLSYNRGPSFSAVGPRYAEMREIKRLMGVQSLGQIPEQFLSMRRLWPQGGDLWRRRGHEADLFRGGLVAQQSPASGNAPRPTPLATPDRSTRALQAGINHVLGLRPALDVDGVYGPATRTAVARFQTFAGLSADGSAGPLTWRALEADMRDNPPP